MLYGSRIALATKSANFDLSPDLSSDLSNYIRRCVFISKLSVTHKITMEDIISSKNLMSQLFDDVSPVYRVVLSDKGNVTCQDAAIDLKNRLNTAIDKLAQFYANKFTKGDKGKFLTSLSNAQDYFLGASDTGTNLMLQNMLINKVRGSVNDAMAFRGATAGMMNYTTSSGMNALRVSEANSFWMAGYRLPMLNACLWILMICLFPIIILLAFFPAFEKAYSSFISTMVWLWTWPPMFSIIHFFVSFYASTKTNIFGQQDGGITMSNLNPISMIHSDMAFTAGFLAMSIPFISKGITSGMSSVFSSVSQLLGSVTQSSFANTSGISQGNLSVANTSGFNANFNKHDFNQTDYRGMSTHQNQDGSTTMTTAEGHHVINSSQAQSNLAVGVNGSQVISQSLSQNATEAKHHGQSLRTSADQSLSSALRQGSSMNSSDSNDYRVGSGVSHSTSSSIRDGYQEMKDAVQKYNEGHKGASSVLMENALEARLNTSGSLIGQVIQKTTGISGSGSTSLRHNNSQSSEVDKFLSSSEGKNFTHGYDKVVSVGKTIHSDGTVGHNLSHAEQFASDLSKASTLAHQASAEFSKSENYSKAATIANSQSSSITTNMTQPFVNWAENNKGTSANQILQGTDTKSIQTQKAWEAEFLSSNEGQQLINTEKARLMGEVKSNTTLGAYESSADTIGNANKINEVHQQQEEKVSEYSSGLTNLSSRQRSKISQQIKMANQSHMMKGAGDIITSADSSIKQGKNMINKTSSDTKGKYDQEMSEGVITHSVNDLIHHHGKDEIMPTGKEFDAMIKKNLHK